MNANTRLITIKEACATLNVGRTLFNALCRSGQIKTVRVGRRGIRIPIIEIDRFIELRLGQ